MNIVYKKTKDLIQYARNNKKHNEKQINLIASSIKEFGFKQPVVVTSDNVIVVGHGRVLASEKLGLETIPCVIADDLSEAQIKAYRITDNKLSELAEWDEEMLALELEELKELDFDIELTGFEFDVIEKMLDSDDKDIEKENEYTTSIKTPIYEIKGEKPSIDELYNTEKTEELINLINDRIKDEKLKKFLLMTATRFTEYNYSKIAEFYAHLDAETQEIFERLALVIVDFEKAIEFGFVKITESIEKIIKREYEDD